MSNGNVNSEKIEMKKKIRKLEKLKMFIASELELAALRKVAIFAFHLKVIDGSPHQSS